MQSKLDKIAKLVSLLCTGLYEREETVSLSLLALISGESAFLLGPPGTAKSLIARRIFHAFEGDPSIFEYLMQRFSTPDEIFGPISIQKLKNDILERKTDGYLPTANFAFLDEIWKSSPAILNTLLTIINEKIFRNGNEILNVPLRGLIGASNETPPKDQGLDALYDRFIIRLFVQPMEDRNNFEALLRQKNSLNNFTVSGELKIGYSELDSWSNEIQQVELSRQTLDIIHEIKLTISSKENKDLNVYVSDRRWKKICNILRASAFLCDRRETNLSDILILRNCLWTTLENRERVMDIISKIIRDHGYHSSQSLEKFDRKKNTLRELTKKLLFNGSDLYKVRTINGENHLMFSVTFQNEKYPDEVSVSKPFFVNEKYLNTDKSFYAVDQTGNEIEIFCNFRGTETCESRLTINRHIISDFKLVLAKPEIQARKGTRKSAFENKEVLSLKNKIEKLEIECSSMIKQLDDYINTCSVDFTNPFVTEEGKSLAFASLDEMRNSMIQRREDINYDLFMIKS